MTASSEKKLKQTQSSTELSIRYFRVLKFVNIDKVFVKFKMSPFQAQIKP